MAKFRAGKTGRTLVGNQPIAHEEWTTRYSGDYIPTDNFEGNGKHNGLIGMKGVDFTLKGKWDAAVNPLDSPPGLYPRDDGGEDGTAITLFVKTQDGTNWSFPLWIVVDANIANAATGAVTFDATCKSQGDFTPPTGSQ